VHPVTYSLLWLRCLFDLISISDFGPMTPKVKIFENVFPDSATGHRTTFREQIWWKSTVAKLPKGREFTKQKNSGSAGLVPVPILAKMGRSRPKLPERCHPLTCPRIPNLVRIGCVLPYLFRKDWFLAKKSQYNIRFQPTIIILYLTHTEIHTKHKTCMHYGKVQINVDKQHMHSLQVRYNVNQLLSRKRKTIRGYASNASCFSNSWASCFYYVIIIGLM